MSNRIGNLVVTVFLAVTVLSAVGAEADDTDTVARESAVQSDLLPSYAALLSTQQVLVNSNAQLKTNKNLSSFAPAGHFPTTEAMLSSVLNPLLSTSTPTKVQLADQAFCDGKGHTSQSPFLERRYLAYTMADGRNILHAAFREYWSDRGACWMKTADAYSAWE